MIRTDYTPNEIASLVDKALKQADTDLHTLGKQPNLRFEEILTACSDAVTPLLFLSSIVPDAAIRKASTEAEEKVREFYVKIMTRRDIFRILHDDTPTKAEVKRLQKETLLGFEANGLGLSDENLAKVIELKKRLEILETQFSTNLNEDASTLDFSPEELSGVPPDYVAALLEGAPGTKRVHAKEPDFVMVCQHATHEATRKKMLILMDARAHEKNTPLLEEALLKRRELAHILGFASWADYRTHFKMSKNAKNVDIFLKKIQTKLVPQAAKDIAQLAAAKKGSLAQWDTLYYANEVKKALAVDEQLIAEYFPSDHVVTEMLHIFEEILGVRFEKSTDAKTWAEGVALFYVLDGKKRIGAFYTDFLPRDGKYGHAAAFTLRSGLQLPDGSYRAPLSAIVANFSRPTKTKPSLLTFQEVETLFHEFGHIMHQVLTKAPYASLSGSSVDHDFVEAPSQMLENWVYSPLIIKRLSHHYTTAQKMPDDLITRRVALRDFNEGYAYTRQILLGLFDLKIHGEAPLTESVHTVYTKLYKELFPSIQILETSYFPTTFGHLMGGYDAGYYGYLWSKVFAEDLFSRFEKEGLLNNKVGAAYRHSILEPGNMQDPEILMEQFLGRAPSEEAFFKRFHL